MLQSILIIALLLLLLGALYWFGVITVDVKRSTMFIGSMHGNRARFRGCTGHTRRRLLFRRGGRITVSLELALTEGAVTVELMDGNRTVALLNAEQPSAVLEIPAGAQYVRIIRFDGASGEYHFTME